MSRQDVRRGVAILGAIVIAASAAVMWLAGPASADTPAAHLLGRGVGTYYSQSDEVWRSVKPGNSVSFSYQVVNDESVPDQFWVGLIEECLGDSPCSTTAQLVTGSFPVNGDHFITPLIAPGNAYTFSETVTAPAGARPQAEFREIDIYNLDVTTFLDSVRDEVSISPAGGSQGSDLFITQGEQPQIGGDGPVGNPEVMASQAIRQNTSVTFALKLKNNSTSAHDVAIAFTDFPECAYVYSIKVTTGFSTDVTALMRGALTVHLNAGASKTYSATVKHLRAFTTACRAGGWRFTTDDGTNANSYLIAAPDGSGL